MSKVLQRAFINSGQQFLQFIDTVFDIVHTMLHLQVNSRSDFISRMSIYREVKYSTDGRLRILVGDFRSLESESQLH